MFCQEFEKTAIKAGTAKRWITARGGSIPEKLKKITDGVHLKPRSKEHYSALKAGISHEKRITVGKRMAKRTMTDYQVDFILGLPAKQRTQ
jgi:hypothetical protein